MKKVFWTLFCLFELTLPVLGENFPGGVSPGTPALPAVADGPQVSISVTPGSCNPTTNQYTLSGTINLVNAVAGSLTVTDGSATTTLNVTTGQTSASFSLAGLQAGSGNHTVTVSGGGYNPTSTTTGPFAIVGATKISCTVLSPTQRQIKFNPQYSGLNGSPVTFAVAGELLATTTPGPYTLNLYNDNPTITLNALQSNVQSTFRYNWLDACNNSSSGYSASTSYTAPASCANTNSQLTLATRVDKAKAVMGDILTYTLVVTNNASTALNNIVIRDSMSTGLTYQANSATPPAGTVFTKGPLTTSTWTINSLSAGQTLALTLRARADSAGVLYNLITASGLMAKACTSIPIKVCTGDTYIFRLILDPGRTNYKWFRNDVEIAGQTTNILDVTAPGAYRMSSDNTAGSCTEYSCCPFIIEEEALPAFQASAQPATCSGNNPQNNASITLTGFNASHSFQYSLGTSFNPAASLSGAAQPIPANGVLVSNLANPASAQAYSIRVYNGAGCYTDATVLVQPANCSSSGARLALAVVAGSCSPATNQYTLSGTISLTNAVASSLTITDGSANTTLNISVGQTSASFSLAGLASGSGIHTVTVSGAGYNPTSTTTSSGSFSLVGVNTISCTTLSPTQRRVSFSPQYTGTNGSPITFAMVGQIAPTTTPGPYTLNLYNDNPAIVVTAQQGPAQSSFTYRWLEACNSGGSGPTATYAASATYTAPASCSNTPTPGNSQLTLATRVDKAKAVMGDILTYTLVVTNNASTALNNIVIRDSMSTGLTYQANSATPPAGTVFTKGPLTTSTWTINSLSAGQTLALTLRARADSAGVLYNLITASGLMAKACTSIPIKVCAGTTYGFRITAEPGQTNYKWFRNDVEIVGQTTNILDVTAPGAYRMSSDNTAGSCTEYSCCPFIIEEEALPAFQASAQPATCSGNNPQNNASITLTGFNASHSFQYSLGTSFNPAASLSGAAQPIPANGVLVSNLANPASAQAYSIRVYNGAGCYTDATVLVQPANCSSSGARLALAVVAGSCSPATNQYTLSGTISLTNAVASSLTITDGSATTTLNISVGQTSASFSLAGLQAGSGTHTVTLSGAGYATTSVVYTAPASCSTTPTPNPPSLALSVTPGNCSPATNQYTLSGTISLTNAVASSLTITDGSATTTLNVTAGQTSASFSLAGLASGSGTHTVTVSGAGYSPSSTTTSSGSFSLVGVNTISCTTLSPTQRRVSFSPQYTGTNGSPITFAMVGQIAPTTTPGPYTLNLYTDNPAIVVTAQQGPAQSSFTYRWLEACNSGGSGPTATYAASATYTAPASCSTTPTPNPPTLALSVTPGNCSPATNQYTLSGTISLTNAVASSLTITDGSATTTLNISVGQTSASFSLAGLQAGSGNHTVTLSGAGYTTTSVVYTAPVSCSTTPTPNPPSLALSVTPGSCNPTTNQYTLSGTISLTNAVASSLTVTDGSATTTLNISVGQTSASFSLAGLASGSGTHTVTVSGVGYNPTSTTTSSGSFSLVGVNTISCTTLSPTQRRVSFSPQYTGTNGSPITFAMVGQIAPTTTPGPYTLNLYNDNPAIVVTAQQGPAQSSFTYRWLEACNSGGSGALIGYTTVSATYTAPASCSTTPTPNPPSLALSVTPGNCIPATNQYTLSGTISLTNAVASSLTVTDGSATTTLNVTAGQTSASFSLAGLASGSGIHTVTVSGVGYNPTSTTTSSGSFSLVGVNTISCTTLSPTQRRVSFSPQYTGTNGSPITFAMVGQIAPTTTPGPYTLNLYNDNPAIVVTAQQGPAQSSFTYRWLEACNSGGSGPTATYAASATYTAPASCSTTPTPNPPTLALSVTPGSCTPTTNQYTLSGTISLTNAVASSLTITDGSATTTLTVTAGQTSASFSLAGLQAGSGTHTVTLSGAGYTTTSVVYTAPASCSTTPTPNPPTLALSVTPGSCTPTTNQYTLSGTISLTNAVASSLTITDGSATTTLTVTAGQTSASFSLAGLASGSGTHTVTVSGAGYSPSSTTTTTGSFSLVGVNTLSCTTLSATQRRVSFNPQYTGTNGSPITFAMVGQIAPTTTPGPYTLNLYNDNPAIVVTAQQGPAQSSFTYRWLEACNSGGSGALIGYTTVSATYTAPASCSTTPTPNPPSLALSVTPGNCIPTTNQYTLAGTITLTNAVSSSLLVTDGTVNKIIPVTAGQISASFNLTGLASGSGSHTVIVSDLGYTPVPPTSPAHIAIVGVTTVNCLTLSPGLRQVLFTPQYAGLTNEPVSFSVTNELLPTTTPGPYSLKLYVDNPMITLYAQQGGSHDSFRYNWLQACTANPGSTTNNTGYTPVAAIYQAPASCKAPASDPAPTPVLSALALTVNPETCDPATNQYKLTGTINLTNAVAGSLLVTDGKRSTVLSVAGGQTTVSFSLMGLPSGSGARSVTVSGTDYNPTTPNSAGPFTIDHVSTISCVAVSATQRQVTFTPEYTGVNGSAISFSVTNEIMPTTIAGPYTLNFYTDNPVVTVNAQQDQAQSTFRYNWLEACNNSRPASTVYAPVTTTYTAPAACFATPQISLAVTPDSTVTKSPNGRVPAAPVPKGNVDKTKAKVGDILTYTLVLTNSGNTDLINAVVRDSASIGLTYVPNSATAPAGTIFTPGGRVSTWTVATLAPNERLSLVFKAKVDSTGILYNTATVQGDTAIVCTSVPVKVCPGSVYSFSLVAKQGRTTYRWYRNGLEIRGETNHILVVTAPGSYSLDPSGGTGLCPDFSCCPFIVEFDTLSAFKAVTVPITCTNNTPQANGKLVISEFDPSFTYQYSLGAQFNPSASLSGNAQTIPSDGVLVNNLTNPAANQPYTVRVYNHTGCYRDVTTVLMPTACACPADACVPFVIQKNKRAR